MWRAFGLLLIIGSVLRTSVGFGAETAEVNLDYVAQRALERAKAPFHSPHVDLPFVLRPENLDYDKYRQIEFRHDRALWAAAGLPFHAEFFHPGYIYHEPVHINEFTASHTQPIRFVQDFFNYHSLNIGKQIPSDTGYAGFRILTELNTTDRWDELGSFLGASYFRLLGKNLRYGESARGLALDCGESDRPEEFPIFTDWWLGKPASTNDDSLHIFAILDSVSCAGAYEFFIHPGDTTTASIRAVVYFREPKQIAAVDRNRKPTKTFGLAPLTSMFWFGKNTERKFDDYRTEVHDSDGLLVHMGNGEVFFRPLDNPSAMRHQVFSAPSIKGFGLMQRERNFAAYQDSFNLYHQVPSVWVEPDGNWGEGDLHLLELSTGYEGLDNIVAFWDPKNKPAPLEPFRFGYTLHWEGGDADLKRSPDRVVSTRVGLDAQFKGARQFVIDFDGPKFDKIPEDKPPVAVASCSGGARIVDNFVMRNTYLGTWRVIVKMLPKPDSNETVDLRCTLQSGTNVIGETWVYQWSPP
ncbi:MAG TPA: glucan biosynthesis protein G [Candidatus Acidoferrales bacterium]|jgi:glucans biosynthesis protein|nr:glucan biosynthesis protein G [Candidatus Acidoferrales bacterium]